MHDLSKLTSGESLWLARRIVGRRTSKPVTQAIAAKRLAISEKQYWKAEADKIEFKAPKVKPNLGDLCALARRRQGWSLCETAGLFNMSAPTLLAREESNDDGLIRQWERMGYRFGVK